MTSMVACINCLDIDSCLPEPEPTINILIDMWDLPVEKSGSNQASDSSRKQEVSNTFDNPRKQDEKI